MGEKPFEYSAFYETLSRKLGYTFSASEQTEINKFIRKATILAPKSHPDAKQENLHALENYFNQKLKDNGVDRILTEVQSQLDAWSAENK